MPATTITRCADPPVPSASGASSLQSAVTVSTKRRPMATTSSASLARRACGRAGAASALDSDRIASTDARTDAAQAVERVAGEVGGGVEEADARRRWRRRRRRRARTRRCTPRRRRRRRAGDPGVARRLGVGRSRRSPAPGRRQVQRRLQLAPFPGRRPRRLVRLAGGHEAHELGEVGRAEQQHRVDVAVADAEPEVEHGAVVVVAGATGRPDDVAAGDRLPGADRDRRQERVGRAQAAGVGDGDVQRAGDANRRSSRRRRWRRGPRCRRAPRSRPRGGRPRTPRRARRRGARPRPSTGRSQPPTRSAAAPAGRAVSAEHRRRCRRRRWTGRAKSARRRGARSWRAHGQPRGRWDDTTTGKRRKEVTPTLPVGRAPAKGQSRRAASSGCQ